MVVFEILFSFFSSAAFRALMDSNEFKTFTYLIPTNATKGMWFPVCFCANMFVNMFEILFTTDDSGIKKIVSNLKSLCEHIQYQYNLVSERDKTHILMMHSWNRCTFLYLQVNKLNVYRAKYEDPPGVLVAYLPDFPGVLKDTLITVDQTGNP